VLESQRRGGPVWVCCALGFSRSAATLVGWLRRHGTAADLADAEAAVRQARPQIVLRPAWRDMLGSAWPGRDPAS